MKTDTTEKGLETLVMRHMTGVDGLSSGASGIVAEAAPQTGGSGWFAGHAASFDREYAVDVRQLFAFLVATQPEETAKLGIALRYTLAGEQKGGGAACTEPLQHHAPACLQP